jgi:SAM-dependent methyltransferase
VGEATAGGEAGWDGYYSAQEGRGPRPLLLDVMGRFSAPARAVDLGSGDGVESLELIRSGWTVLAIDAEPAGIERLLSAVAPEDADRLTTHVARFEDLGDLPPSELVYAGYSLAFCASASFAGLWAAIRAALVPGGRFAGQLFGDRDSWANPDATFVSRSEAEGLLGGLELERFDEEERDGSSFVGPKHWHLFHVIARRP